MGNGGFVVEWLHKDDRPVQPSHVSRENYALLAAILLAEPDFEEGCAQDVPDIRIRH